MMLIMFLEICMGRCYQMHIYSYLNCEMPHLDFVNSDLSFSLNKLICLDLGKIVKWLGWNMKNLTSHRVTVLNFLNLCDVFQVD